MQDAARALRFERRHGYGERGRRIADEYRRRLVARGICRAEEWRTEFKDGTTVQGGPWSPGNGSR